MWPYLLHQLDFIVYEKKQRVCHKKRRYTINLIGETLSSINLIGVFIMKFIKNTLLSTNNYQEKQNVWLDTFLDCRCFLLFLLCLPIILVTLSQCRVSALHIYFASDLNNLRSMHSQTCQANSELSLNGLASRRRTIRVYKKEKSARFETEK